MSSGPCLIPILNNPDTLTVVFVQRYCLLALVVYTVYLESERTAGTMPRENPIHPIIAFSARDLLDFHPARYATTH